MAWWKRQQAQLEEIPESLPDEDLAYEYEEPERGPFDHPHRIRPVQQMLDDDLANPITADGFLAYCELLGRQGRTRTEFDLSTFECVPEPNEIEGQATDADIDGIKIKYPSEPEVVLDYPEFAQAQPLPVPPRRKGLGERLMGRLLR